MVHRIRKEDAEILTHLRMTSSADVSSLAADTLKTPSEVTEAVQRLRGEGLVEVRRSPFVRLTHEGQRVAHELMHPSSAGKRRSVILVRESEAADGPSLQELEASLDRMIDDLASDRARI